MQSSALPAKIQLPFANGGSKNTIPVSSQIGVTAGAASFTDGFPPLTRTPLAAGGVPPSGADMNGILNAITAIQQWQCSGGLFKFDSSYVSAIGGYPKGAVLSSSSGLTQWRNFVEGNTTDPDGASPSGWVSVEGALANFVSYNASQTITLAQAGSLIGYASTTANGSFTLPSPAGQAGLNFSFTNYSAFNLTITTPNGVFTRGGGGTSITLPQGSGVVIASDGVNWQLLHGDAALQYSSLFASQKTTNGYKKIGDIILQWGSVSTSGGTATGSFSIGFPSACVVFNPVNFETGLNSYLMGGYPTSLGGFTVFSQNSNNGSGISATVPWFAIGY